MSISRAMWAGDVDELNRIAGCICCCAEHTFTTGCPAYQWGGCRGQGSLTSIDVQGWMEHYGMTPEQFHPKVDLRDLPHQTKSG